MATSATARSNKNALAVNCALAQEMADRWGCILPNFEQLQTLHRVMHAEFLPESGKVQGDEATARADYGLLEAQTRELLGKAESPGDKILAMAFYQARLQQLAPFGLGSGMIAVITLGTQMKNLVDGPKHFMEHIYGNAGGWREGLTSARQNNDIGPLMTVLAAASGVPVPALAIAQEVLAPFAIRADQQPAPGPIAMRLDESRSSHRQRPEMDLSVAM